MGDPAPKLAAFSIRGPISRGDLRGICDRVRARPTEAGPGAVEVDVYGIVPDAVTVDALARLQLAARRTGCCLRLVNASSELLELVAFMGLEDVLCE